LEDLTWSGVSQWLRQGGAGGEVLLVFENTENVLMHDKEAEVRKLCLAECGSEACAAPRPAWCCGCYVP
jgi:hypothetical protein